MTNDQLTCDSDRIELFLQQNLPGDEQAAFEFHLDDCDECRRQLEEAAAGDDVWSGVRESLAEGPLFRDEDMPTSGPPAGESASFQQDAILRLLAPTDDERMLGRLGPYEVVGVIGSGGMGVVLKAFDPALNRYVAIKVLAPHFGGSGAARKRFRREAQSAAAVVHDNVIEIHSVADTDGLPYLVMPYLRGPSLQCRLDEHGPLAVVEILRIAQQAAAGLAAAHAQGLVHRDVKPANILLADGIERVKLTDFGLARAADDASLTRTGMIAGTPQYMSPQQSRGESIDQRSDLFSLGSVLYSMCTGRAPFRAETSYGVLRLIADTEPRSIREINPDIPEWLCRIVEKLMSKEPGDRFESAVEVAALLEQCLAHIQQPTVVALPQTLTETKRQDSKRVTMLKRIAAAALACALIVAGVAIVLETNKGLLTINCTADNVPVRIKRGDTVVENLTVTRAGATIRVAAGRYTVEIDGDADGIMVENGTVTLKRRGTAIVTISKQGDVAKTAGRSDHQQSVKNLKQLILALHKYFKVHNSFPPAAIQGKHGNGKVAHSWRVALLPYLGEQALYDRYHFDEPWDSKHNRSLLPKMPEVFRSPRDRAASVNTSYFGVVATDVVLRENNAGGSPDGFVPAGGNTFAVATFFDRSKTRRITSITDGTSHSIAVVEAKRDIPWTKPEDINYAAFDPLPKLGGWYQEGWYAGFADGEIVKFLAADNDEKTIRGLLSINGGEVVKPRLITRGAAVPKEEPSTSMKPVVGKDEGRLDKTYRSSDTLSAMKGWVIAWDVQHDQRGGGKRLARLRVFADGRILAVSGIRQPLLQARINANDVRSLVKEWKAQATVRDLDNLLLMKNKIPLLAGDYKKLQAKLKQTADELNLGDPLPITLWNQFGQRVTIRDSGKIYDLLSITPPHPERPDPTGTRKVAAISPKIAKRLQELIKQASVSGVVPKTAGSQAKRKVHKDSVTPTGPVYGGRNRKTGMLELNPLWAQPVRRMLSTATAIEVAAGGKRVHQKIPSDVHGDTAQKLIGVVVALVGDGSVAWKTDRKRVVLINTIQKSAQVAESLLPAALDHLVRRYPTQPLRLKQSSKPGDPVPLAIHAKRLRGIAVENLLSEEPHLFESARWFWELSMSYQQEDDLRLQSQQHSRQTLKQQAVGKLKEAEASKAESQRLALQADEVAALRRLEERRRERDQRFRHDAKQLAAQITILKEEGKLAEAAQLEVKLDNLLRNLDPDWFRVRDLHERAIEARTRGQHAIADRLEAERRTLLKTINRRYPHATRDAGPKGHSGAMGLHSIDALGTMLSRHEVAGEHAGRQGASGMLTRRSS